MIVSAKLFRTPPPILGFRAAVGAALAIVLAASVLTGAAPVADAAGPFCQSAAPALSTPMQSAIAVDPGSTTIPGGVRIAAAPTDNIAAIGGQVLMPDAADPETFMFNWRYPPRGAGPTPYPNPKAWAVRLDVAGTRNIEFQVYARQNAAWSMSLDGRPAPAIPTTDSSVADGRYLIRYALPDAGVHQIRFGMNNLALGQVFADPGATAQPAPVVGPRVFFLGDSLTQGGAQSTGGELGSWIWAFAGMCGFGDVWNGGIGGTGSIATGRDGLWADYPTRAATDVGQANPNIVFVTSYYGDRLSAPADIAAAFTRTVEVIRSLPAPPEVIVTGAYDPTGRNGAPYTEIDRALSAACASLAVPYIEPRTGNVYDAAGAPVTPAGPTGPWITAANRSALIGADGVHQNDAGQLYMSQRMYEAYRALP